MEIDSHNEGASKNILISDKITFNLLANILEKINKIDEKVGSNRSVPKNEEKKRILKNFHELWQNTRKALKKNEESNENQISRDDESYFPIIRLLLPSDDRRTYGLKETRLAKFLIEALCISPKSDDALKLINYRAPNNAKIDGDFASVAFYVLKNRCQETSTLSIHEINKHLDKISFNNAKG